MIFSTETNKLYDKFITNIYRSNHLDIKTKELIAVSCSVMADCVPCIEYHYGKAIKAGASREEITEAIEVAIAICSGSKKGKYSELFTDLKEKYK